MEESRRSARAFRPNTHAARVRNLRLCTRGEVATHGWNQLFCATSTRASIRPRGFGWQEVGVLEGKNERTGFDEPVGHIATDANGTFTRHRSVNTCGLGIFPTGAPILLPGWDEPERDLRIQARDYPERANRSDG